MGEKQNVMPVPRSHFYARWRAGLEAQFVLREGGDSPLSEKILQGVWHYQRVLRDQLKTVDGKPVRVLHPGFWNREAGPDFQGAVVQIGDEAPRSGDIEIDLTGSGWRGHGHDRNPAYKNVILHVIWKGGAENSSLPAVALENFLDASFEEIQAWFKSDAAQGWPEEVLGECCAPLREISAEDALDLLHQAGEIRFHSKARALEARARQCGWDQALWEGLLRALGYKKNVWPMQRLAEVLPWREGQSTSLIASQARFFGLGNLLPEDVTKDANADSYIRQLWDYWCQEQSAFNDFILPKNIWRFNGLRPANQPQRRLALAAHWMVKSNLVFKLQNWFLTGQTEKSLADSLLECLQAGRDDFWSEHWNFKSSRMTKPQPLLGAQRVNDIAVNVILPWFWIRAGAGKNAALKKAAEERYFDWPATQDNAVLRMARLRLFGRGSLRWLKTAAAQQGLLQIVRDCCNHSNAVCADCPFPNLVRSWQAGKKGSLETVDTHYLINTQL